MIRGLKGITEGTMYRWNSNRFLIMLFYPAKDLHESRVPTPPCLTILNFLPVKNGLSLIATFRAQYTDTKGYGNLLSLAYLLLSLCEGTGFRPAQIYSIANKPILKWPIRTARSLLAGIGG